MSCKSFVGIKKEAVPYASKVCSSVMKSPTAVDCNVDFDCAQSADENSFLHVRFEDVKILLGDCDSHLVNKKYLRLPESNQSTKCTKDLVWGQLVGFVKEVSILTLPVAALGPSVVRL